MRAPHKDTDTDFQELPSSANIEIQPNTPAEESMEDIKLSMKEISGSDKIVVDGNDEKPAISQYWEISNGCASLYRVVIENDLFMVLFYELTTNAYLLKDSLKLEVFLEFGVLHSELLLNKNVCIMYLRHTCTFSSYENRLLKLPLYHFFFLTLFLFLIML